MKAYPFSHRHPTTGVTTSSEGMDLRDYFAGLVLQGFAARDTHDAGLVTPEQRAKLAYIDADAMMEARIKTNEQS